MKLKDYNPVY